MAIDVGEQVIKIKHKFIDKHNNVYKIDGWEGGGIL